MKRLGVFITCLIIMMGGSAVTGYAGQEKVEEQEKSQDKDKANHHVKKMTNARLLKLIKRIDPNPTGRIGNWQIKFEGHSVEVMKRGLQ